MLTSAAYALYLTTIYQGPEDVGDYFIVHTNDITNNKQKLEESKWQARKNLLDTYRNIRTALQHLFEISIAHAYHSGGMTNTGMAKRRFGNNKPPVILERLNKLYVTTSLQ